MSYLQICALFVRIGVLSQSRKSRHSGFQIMPPDPLSHKEVSVSSARSAGASGLQVPWLLVTTELWERAVSDYVE